jgi:hypothetical protein
MAVIHVTTGAELQAAINAAVGGDVITLNPISVDPGGPVSILLRMRLNS